MTYQVRSDQLAYRGRAVTAVAVPLPPKRRVCHPLAGDVGAIGRLVVLPPTVAGIHAGGEASSSRAGDSDGPQLILDLKGHQYAGVVVPCATLMVVGFGKDEARVESIVTDFIQLEHLSVRASRCCNA